MFDFKEPAVTLTKAEVAAEAKRCLGCAVPLCQRGCPAVLPIKDFLKALSSGDASTADALIETSSSLPLLCSRVCDRRRQCEGSCALNRSGRPIKIGALERWAAEQGDQKRSSPLPGGPRVAVIGSGPAGLAAAITLLKRGFKAEVFEAEEQAGGLLFYGIPQYRLPISALELQLKEVARLGGVVHLKERIEDIQVLKDRGFFRAFLAIGLGTSRLLNIPGANLGGVEDGVAFLKRLNLFVKAGQGECPVLGKTVAVIGGGNVAVDCARAARRLAGVKEVSLVYRRSAQEAPASRSELEEAEKEGVKLCFLESPTAIIKDEVGLVLKTEKMSLGAVDPSGRPTPLSTGEYVCRQVDRVLVAIGQQPGSNFLAYRSAGGLVAVSESFRTTDPFVYAGGDVVSGPKTVVSAMVQGQRAAAAIAEEFEKKMC